MGIMLINLIKLIISAIATDLAKLRRQGAKDKLKQ